VTSISFNINGRQSQLTQYLSIETYRLKVFEKRVLRRIFGLNTEEVARGWGNCTIKSFIKMTAF
jgi:hypothetical protein